MAKGASGTSRWGSALILGLLATLAVVVAHWAGLDERVELQALDLRFRWLGNAPPADYIVHVDIDDGSLERLGRWPWPRQQIARVAEILLDCDAQLVALDIIMPEPQKLRYESEAAAIYAGTDETTALLGGESLRTVFDDRRLAAAIRKDPNRVFMPMFIRIDEDESDRLGEQLTRRITTRPALSLDESRGELTRAAKTPEEARSVQGEGFSQAYLRARALSALGRLSLPVSRAGRYPLLSGAIVPPLIVFAEAIGHTGFVTVIPDADGVVRRLPMLARSGDRVYPQFALAMAAEHLSRRQGRPAMISAGASSVTIRCGDDFERVVPVDRKGSLLVNWTAGGEGSSARHIPIAAVAAIDGLKNDLKDLDSVRRVLLARLMELALDEVGEDARERAEELYFALAQLYRDKDSLYKRMVAAKRAHWRATLFDPGRVPPTPAGLAKARQKNAAQIETQFTGLQEFLLTAKGLRGPGGNGDARRQIAEGLVELEKIPAQKRKKREQISAEMNKLWQIVAGRICLVGSTATGAADFVPTPVHERTPGVVVHANILNTIVSGAFIRQTGPITEALVILLAGTVITILASQLSALHAGPVGALAAVAYVAFNALVVFHLWSVWLAAAAPLAAMVASFLVVTAYRQLTEERAKRQIRRMFSHALSDALVDRLMEDPSLARLGGERRVLSCFFSDLAGFTSLSERLGEQRTVRVLNHYFDHMTDVLQTRHGGYLNKFLGDGILALFGAPVLLTDHAARGIRAALDCHRELGTLNAEIAAEHGDGIVLACRIGIATGEVMVGNCGSTDRMDYTAIGDTVNLASRLESANKFFKTATLVDGETWRLAELGDVLARPMGKVVVVGRNEPVPILAPIARMDEADERDKKLAVDFSGALDLFGARDFAGAAEALEGILADWPGDVPAKIYLDLARQYLASPPPDDWSGELVLPEK